MKVSAFLTSAVLHKGRDIGVFAITSDSPGSVFVVHVEPRWIEYPTRVEWPAVGIAGVRYPGADDLLVMAIGAEGHTWALSPGSQREQLGQVPGDLSGITRIVALDEALWICGMGRLVWMRDANGEWQDRSAPASPPGDGVIGFTAMASDRRGRIAAVGWRGEIWVRENEQWAAQERLTERTLNAISASPSGTFVAVGDAGTLITGAAGAWTAHTTRLHADLQGVCHFQDEVFVCSDHSLYRWTGTELVPETRFADDDGPSTCLNLAAGQSSVMSQGEADVFRFVDGEWTRIYGKS